jgi:hypothetical protein
MLILLTDPIPTWAESFQLDGLLSFQSDVNCQLEFYWTDLTGGLPAAWSLATTRVTLSAGVPAQAQLQLWAAKPPNAAQLVIGIRMVSGTSAASLTNYRWTSGTGLMTAST